VVKGSAEDDDGKIKKENAKEKRENDEL